MKKKKEKTLIVTGDDVNQIVERFGPNRLMDKLIGNLTTAIETFDARNTEIPIRSGFNYTANNPGLVEWMPLHKKGEEITIKVVGYHPRNPEKFQLPTILSTISCYDITTGHLKGLIDGVLLTALRTGAVSAVASKYLADPNSSILGLIGCGAQAVTQLHALSRIFEFKKILINDIAKESLTSFKDRCEILGITAEIISAPVEVIMKESDIVCTTTSIDIDEGPLFDNIPTNNKLHINAVGSDFPGKIELPLSLLKNSIVVPDFIEQAMIEGECQQLEKSMIGPDLVHLVQNHKNFEEAKNQRTVFDSTGWALEDQVVMDLFFDLAGQFGVGKEFKIENTSEDAKNPYHFLLKEIEV